MNLGFEGMCLTVEFWNSQLSVGYLDFSGGIPFREFENASF